MRNHLMIT